jgi:hypothetical protein
VRELKTLTGRTVIVVTGETALEGVVESATRTCVTLVDARAVDGPTPVPVDGSVLVPTSRIAYVQVVPK